MEFVSSFSVDDERNKHLPSFKMAEIFLGSTNGVTLESSSKQNQIFFLPNLHL